MRLMRTRSYVMPTKPAKSLRAEAARTRPTRSKVTVSYDPVKIEELWQKIVLLTSNEGIEK